VSASGWSWELCDRVGVAVVIVALRWRRSDVRSRRWLCVAWGLLLRVLGVVLMGDFRGCDVIEWSGMDDAIALRVLRRLRCGCIAAGAWDVDGLLARRRRAHDSVDSVDATDPRHSIDRCHHVAAGFALAACDLGVPSSQ
jgi:hypothetical protein